MTLALGTPHLGQTIPAEARFAMKFFSCPIRLPILPKGCTILPVLRRFP
jgi:hypothetical protein